MKQIKLFFTNKRNRKMFIAIALIACMACGGAWTLARYVFGQDNNAVIGAKNFYFTSDKLNDITAGEEAATHNIPWLIATADGVSFDVNIKNYKYLNTRSQSDIPYTLTAQVDDANAALFDVSIDAIGPDISETLYFDRNENVYHNLSVAFNAESSPEDFVGDSFTITVTAQSESPYQKTLQAVYSVFIYSGALFSYQVDDTAGFSAAELQITVPADIDHEQFINAENMMDITLVLAPASGLVPDPNDSRITFDAVTGEYTIKLASGSVGRFLLYKTDVTQNYGSNGSITAENPYTHFTLTPVIQP